jgi:hypothetical protein|eukprot:COSAG06_NODE_5491_length_3444_cov_4.457262_3_plen_182_part_00
MNTTSALRDATAREHTSHTYTAAQVALQGCSQESLRWHAGGAPLHARGANSPGVFAHDAGHRAHTPPALRYGAAVRLPTKPLALGVVPHVLFHCAVGNRGRQKSRKICQPRPCQLRASCAGCAPVRASCASARQCAPVRASARQLGGDWLAEGATGAQRERLARRGSDWRARKMQARSWRA